MALGKGHQAIMETAYGMTKVVNGQMTVTNVKRFPADKVNPPEGIKSTDWIKGGFKAPGVQPTGPDRRPLFAWNNSSPS